MSRSLVEQQFGPSARHYAECEVHRSGESLNRLVELVEPKPEWKALDVATGAGHTAAVFAPHVAHVVASDITPEMLDQSNALAIERGLTNFSTATAQAQDLPFEDESFDLITCRLAAHHFPDIASFVNESTRVLRPDGILAIVDNIPPDATTVPGLAASDVEKTAVAYNEFEKLRDPSHARALSTQEWRGHMTSAGLKVTAVELMEKEMGFTPWVERMRCDARTVGQLNAILRQSSPLATFLKPREFEGDIHFSLREAIIVAGKIL
ncbi:MAG: class I SAM-dependent methyltransferase [Alphaproteobacteria bacterium]|nr:class I SAM-dependent methyltransferase [Alphaproteobacteria bacterium]